MEYLDQIRMEVEGTGAIYTMVIQPDQYQIDQDLRDRLAESSGVDERDVEMDLPQTLLREYCDSEGIPCLDLFPVLEGVAARENLYLENDTHYNLRGNSLVGQEIARFVEEVYGHLE